MILEGPNRDTGPSKLPFGYTSSDGALLDDGFPNENQARLNQPTGTVENYYHFLVTEKLAVFTDNRTLELRN